MYKDAEKNGTLVGSWDVNSPQPWVKIDGFDSLEVMENYVRRMRMKIFLNPRRLMWIIKSYGISIIKNPIIFLKTALCFTLFKKAKY